MDIVRFKGGLGNQMFQYAFLKSLESRNREVIASLGFYSEHPELMQYELDKVFPNIVLKTEENDIFIEEYSKWYLIKNDKILLKKFIEDIPNRFFWAEKIEENGNYQEKVYDTTNCVFAGYWQSYKYFNHIREKLLLDFKFQAGENRLIKLKKVIAANNNFVSVHVRCGDYFQADKIYGNICTIEYYKTALREIQKYVKKPVFVFFSDDIDWVKKHMIIDGAIYVEKSMFEDYKLWYDMSLMSVCSYNIIANSSFGWWGAWLNQREGRKVIAPRKWINGYEFNDICPKEWIRL